MDLFEGRRQRLQALLHQEALDLFLATTEPTCFYFTRALGSRPHGFLLATRTAEAVLLARPVEEVEVRATSLVPVLGAGRDALERLASVISDLAGPSARVGFEEDAVTVETFQSWRRALPRTEFMLAGRLVRRLRTVKDRDEVEEIRAACAVTDEAMAAAVGAVKRGEPESLAAAAAESTMRRHGMFIAYETLIGSGLRSALLRRYPSRTVPGPQEMVRLDLAAKKSYASGYGYHSDMTRSLTPAPPLGRSRDQLEVNLAVQRAALEAIRPGRTIAEASREGLRQARGTSFEGLTHMSGHGLGLDIHEWPAFNETTEVELLPGMVFAVEPSIVIPGEQATCFEDTVLVTETGCERLTKLPAELWTT